MTAVDIVGIVEIGNRSNTMPPTRQCGALVEKSAPGNQRHKDFIFYVLSEESREEKGGSSHGGANCGDW